MHTIFILIATNYLSKISVYSGIVVDTDGLNCYFDCTYCSLLLGILYLIGCQIVLTKELDRIKVTLPKATRNFYVDGHVPQPH